MSEKIRPTLGELYQEYGQGLPPPPERKEGTSDEEWEDTKAYWQTNIGRILAIRYQQSKRKN